MCGRARVGSRDVVNKWSLDPLAGTFSFADRLGFYYTPNIGFCFVLFVLDYLKGEGGGGGNNHFHSHGFDILLFSFSGMFVERAASCSNAFLTV